MNTSFTFPNDETGKMKLYRRFIPRLVSASNFLAIDRQKNLTPDMLLSLAPELQIIRKNQPQLLGGVEGLIAFVVYGRPLRAVIALTPQNLRDIEFEAASAVREKLECTALRLKDSENKIDELVSPDLVAHLLEHWWISDSPSGGAVVRNLKSIRERLFEPLLHACNEANEDWALSTEAALLPPRAAIAMPDVQFYPLYEMMQVAKRLDIQAYN